jgi:hypothetical protein
MQVYIAQRMGAFPDPAASTLVAKCKDISAMLHGLITSLIRNAYILPLRTVRRRNYGESS